MRPLLERFQQFNVVFFGIIGNRYDAARVPVLQFDIVRGFGTDETEPLLEVGEVCAVPGDHVQKVAHRGIIGTVSDEDEVVEARRVVDEVGDDPSSQVGVPEVLVREHEVGGGLLIVGKRPVDVEHAREFRPQGGAGNRA